MGKTKINFRYLILLFLISLSISSYSQESFTKELLWDTSDSIENLFFNDTSQITDWGKNQLPFSTVFTKSILANNTEVFVLMISGCSGLPCWNIYVFRKVKKIWCLKAKTNARLTEQIEMDTDFSQKKIIFKTKSDKIGELSLLEI